MSIRTGICRHCGKKEEDHYGSEWYEDSGLFALDAHKEELYEAIIKCFEAKDMAFLPEAENWERKVRSILNQIDKEK